jgi:hypothetical protein
VAEGLAPGPDEALIGTAGEAIARSVAVLRVREDWGVRLLLEEALARRMEVSVSVGRRPEWRAGSFSVGLDAAPLFVPDPAGIAESVDPSSVASLGGLRPGSWRRGSRTDAQVADDVVTALRRRLALFVERYGRPEAYALNCRADVYDDPQWVATEEVRAYCLVAAGRPDDARASLRLVAEAGEPSRHADGDDRAIWRRVQERARTMLARGDADFAEQLDDWERQRRREPGLIADGA